MPALRLLLEKSLPAFAPLLAQLSGEFFRFGLAVHWVLQAHPLAAQEITIAVQPFLDVGGGCFVRSCVHDQLRPLHGQELMRLA